MYNLKNIMKRAWELKKENKDNVFGLCLKMAWMEAKEIKKENTIGNETAIELEITYRRGMYYGEVFSAEEVSTGILEISYNTNTEWEKESNTTSIIHHTLKAGIYNTDCKTDVNGNYYYSHNINWENVKEVRGKTYNIKGFLKDKGFVWNKDKQAWIK